jgi:hypothetical protein
LADCCNLGFSLDVPFVLPSFGSAEGFLSSSKQAEPIPISCVKSEKLRFVHCVFSRREHCTDIGMNLSDQHLIENDKLSVFNSWNVHA